jgi:hypothetical protein
MNSSNNLDSIINEKVSVHNLLFSHSLGFSFPLNISGSFSMSFANYPWVSSRILSGDISADYTLFEIANSFIGFSTAYEKNLNKKNMFYIGTRVGYASFITMEVRGEKNLYHDWFDTRNNFDEFLLRGIVTTRF